MQGCPPDQICAPFQGARSSPYLSGECIPKTGNVWETGQVKCGSGYRECGATAVCVVKPESSCGPNNGCPGVCKDYLKAKMDGDIP